MIKNRCIIVFSDDWGRFPSTLQHIIKFLLPQIIEVIWIGSLGLRKPELSLKDLRRVFEKLKRIFTKTSSTDREESDIILLNPFVIPFHDSKFFRKINSLILATKINSAIKKYQFKDSIILTSSAIVSIFLDQLTYKSCHYFCLDDYTLFKGAFRSIEKLEQELMKKVNASFSISETLKNTRVPVSGHNYFLPQGVDVHHFTKNSSEKLPKEIVKLKKPVVGFFGLISEWVDVHLMADCAKKYPQFNFVFVGPSVIDISLFDPIKNIYCTGEVSFNELPNYANSFDVGLIPFIVNDLTIAANPLKLLEYFACGIPVVSTNLPEINKFNELVYVAENSVEFVEMIGTAASDNNALNNIKRLDKAKEFSWENIAESVSNNILASE